MKRSILALAGVALTAIMSVGCMAPSESSALAAINHDRAVNGIPALVANQALNAKAQSYANYLAARSGGQCSMATLVHSNLATGAPDGWRMLGENIGCRIAPGDIASFVAPLQASFMNSPGHRANILNGTFNRGGTGLAAVPAAAGNGWYVVYEAQEFALI